MDEVPRTRVARAAAEAALVRVVHHYGECPEFVLLGGLVPELLCSASPYIHAGTTDVDVQVDLEIAAGAVHTARLERALRNAEFEPDAERAWRWVADVGDKVVVRFELLADLDHAPEERPSPSMSATIWERSTCVGRVMRRGTARFASWRAGSEALYTPSR